MNIKKILVLLLFLVAILGIITPVNAKLDYCETWSDSKVINGKTKMTWGLCSDIGDYVVDWDSPKYSIQERKEVNKVIKGTVKIDGYKTLTFKKPKKGWMFTGITESSLYKSFSVKGSPINKSYTIKCYDKNGKIIKQSKGKVKYNPYHQGL